MRSHQKEGSQFILECLKGKSVRKSGYVSESESGSGSGSDTLFSELIPPLIAENVSERDDDDDDDDDFERQPGKKSALKPRRKKHGTLDASAQTKWVWVNLFRLLQSLQHSPRVKKYER